MSNGRIETITGPADTQHHDSKHAMGIEAPEPPPPPAPLTRRAIAEFRERVYSSPLSVDAVTAACIALDHLDASLFLKVNDRLGKGNQERQKASRAIQEANNTALQTAIEQLAT